MREAAVGRVKLPSDVAKPAARAFRRSAEDIRREMEALERTLAELDEKRHALDAKLSEPTGDDELQRLCDELAEVADAHDAAEQKWLALQAELDTAE